MRIFLALFCGLLLLGATAQVLADDALSPTYRRMEALAIGEMTLAYRLVALTASLAISAAAENDALFSLLENVEGTLANGKAFLSTQGAKGPFTKEITALIDETLSCSQKVRGYTANKSYENLQKIRACIDALDGRIADLSDRFNKAAPIAPATPAPSQTK